MIDYVVEDDCYQSCTGKRCTFRSWPQVNESHKKPPGWQWNYCWLCCVTHLWCHDGKTPQWLTGRCQTALRWQQKCWVIVQNRQQQQHVYWLRLLDSVSTWVTTLWHSVYLHVFVCRCAVTLSVRSSNSIQPVKISVMRCFHGKAYRQMICASLLVQLMSLPLMYLASLKCMTTIWCQPT